MTDMFLWDDKPVEDDIAEGQVTLFGDNEEFNRAFLEWRGMPEFHQDDITPYAAVLVQFATEEDMRAFAELVNQPVGRHRQTRGIWYPARSAGVFRDKRYRGTP